MNKLRGRRIVEILDDERSIGNGLIVTLKQGWTFTPGQDNRVIGADTYAEMNKILKYRAVRFEGPYTP